MPNLKRTPSTKPAHTRTNFDDRLSAAAAAKQALLERFRSLDGHDVYCCGAPPMVVAVKKACVKQRGLDAAHFYSDVFVPGPAAG